jgi:hypothetical protein
LVLGRSLSIGSGNGSVYSEGIGAEIVTGRFAEARFCSSNWNGDICGRCEALRALDTALMLQGLVVPLLSLQ